MNRPSLTRFAWLSIAAALATIALKTAAYLITGSVGLLSDAVESLVNLVGGFMALAMLTIAARPADEDHAYGHGKAEYFSSGVEGGLILVAAVSIAIAAVLRLITPKPLEELGVGLAVSAAASLVNLAVALLLLRVGKKHNSITLEANARHLITDVWTSVGVIVGVGLVALTNWLWLDPVVALLVAVNIVRTGVGIVRRSIAGLMDIALPAEDMTAVRKVLETYEQTGVQFHALRSRQAGARKFVSTHVLVPGDWTVQRGHELLDKIEADIRRVLPDAVVFTHLESLDDPASWDDETFERENPTRPSAVVIHQTHFKGWAKPGPIPPGLGAPSTASARTGPDQLAETVLGAPLVIEPHETLDAISGRFRLFQLRDGHRFSTDDLLTAWYGTSWCPTAHTALDLGSGIGSVGMICAWRLPGARFVTVEAQPESAALARKSARYNGLTDRYEIRIGDFREGSERGQPCPREPNATEEPADKAVRAPAQPQPVLRPDERFDLITGSPPYFPPAAGVKSENPQKLACRFELRGTVADYCATAAKHLAPGGFFACVFQIEPVAQLARVQFAAQVAGLVIVRQRPVIFREGEPPLIALFGMMRAEDLPAWFRGQTWTEPPLTIRTREGKIHPEYSAVKLSFGFSP